MSRDRQCTHSTCNGHALFYKARRIDVHWPSVVFGRMACPRDRSCYKTDTSKNEDGNVTRNVCVNSVVCISEFCSVKISEHHSHVSNKMTFSLLAASVDMSGTFKLAVSFASTLWWTSRTHFLKDHVDPFAAGWCQPFFQEQLRPDATYHSWHLAQKKRKRSPARNRS